ncbi:MAG: DUF2975 domain-containing protein [Muribaculaceae bacterium]
MKKTSINILCIFIIAILASSVITPAYYICTVFISGVKSGYSQYQGHISETASLDSYKPTQTVPVDLSFSPDIPTMLAGSDTITIGNSEHYPLTFTRATIHVPSEKWGESLSNVTILIYVACFVLFVLLMVQFIKFIININKGEIFVRRNVTLLRRFAWYLLSIAIMKCIAGLIEDYMFSQLGFTIPGYQLSTFWTIPWGSLLMGLLAMLMAQIWSRGLEMKEEQELTI